MIEKIKEKIKWVRSPDFSAGLAFFFLSFFFFYDLFKGRFLLIERDLGPYFIPPRFFWVESIKHGSFPLWNPYQFSGHPFFANPQYGLLYPFNGLFFLFPFDIAFNVIIILHFFLGGLFTYLFLKDLKVQFTGALISGLIFMLSGYLLSVHSLLNTLLSIVWTPLIMMFFMRAIRRQGFKNEMITAILITLSFLGGGIEIVYGNFFVLLMMLFFFPRRSIDSVGDKPLRYKLFYSIRFSKFLGSVSLYWGRIRSLAIVSILFIFLSAVQLFPFVELFHHSIRGSGISYQEATVWSFAPKDILLFFLPDVYGYFLDAEKYWLVQCWLKTLYTGGLPFILSLIFYFVPSPLFSASGEEIYNFARYRTFFLALMFLSIFLSLGGFNPLYFFVLKYIPFFNGIRYPVKFLYIFILALSITAGMGFQRLIELPKESGRERLINIFMVLSLVSGFLLLILVLEHQKIETFLKLKDLDYPQYNLLSINLRNAKRFFFFLAIFFLLIRIGHERKWRSWAKILLILFLTADLFGNMGYYSREETKDYFKKNKSLEIVSSDKSNYRVFSTAKTTSMDATILISHPSYLDLLKEKNIPTMNLFYPFRDIWGIDVIRVKRTDDLYNAFIGAPSISATHLIDLYGVKYITSVTPLEEKSKFELIYARLENLQGKREDLLKENTIKLYKNRSPLPRAWLVSEFKVMDSQTILWTMLQKEFPPGQVALLEEKPNWTNPPTPPFREGGERGLNIREPLRGRPKTVQIMSEGNNRLELQVSAKENSLLVLSDTFFPGWKAFVDGKKTRIYRADYNFRAIPLTAGTHRVEFVYDPMSFRLGGGATLLGIFGCIGMGWAARRRVATNYTKESIIEKTHSAGNLP